MEEKQLILLVDNDQEFCRATRKMLMQSGYGVSTARDGQEAIDVLSEKSFGVVISEVRMPGLDGIELMEEINRRSVDVHVIYLTAYGEVESYMDLMNMGAFDYLNKPVKERELLRAITNALMVNLEC